MKHATCNKRKNATRYMLHDTCSGGFTLFYAVLVGSLMLAIGLAIFNITYKEFTLTAGARESESAFYAADAAMECALYFDLVHAGISSPAFGYFGNTLAGGLQGFWRFEEESGDALDSSGHGDSGTLNNMSSGARSTSYGYIGQGVSFDGIDDYISMDNINLADGNTPHTISAWVRVTSYPVARSWPLLLGGSGVGSHHWLINGADNSEGRAEGEMQIGSWGGGQAYPIIPLNSYTHIVTVFDGSQLRVYMDGSEVAGSPVSSTFDLDGGIPLTLAKDYAGEESFTGYIDEVRIYNRALSQDEVEALNQNLSVGAFADPISQGSGAFCAGEDITDPATGWQLDEFDQPVGWTHESSVSESNADTTFDLLFDDNTCALVHVFKDTASTTIISRGYNTCDLDNPRRVERAIKARY